MQTLTIDIPGRCLGTVHSITAYRFGEAGSGPSIYVQGGLHADEGPGMLAARALCDRLEQREKAGLLAGQVTVVPAANPVGLSQFMLGQQEGRFDLQDGRNFNRNYPDLASSVVDGLGSVLGQDAAANVSMIRKALMTALNDWQATTPADHLRKALMGLALSADWVLDLHCDGEAEVHLYTQETTADDFAVLARHLGARAILVAEISGDNPFDEAMARPWLDLARAFPGHPIPLGCKSTTVELRGRLDVDRQTAVRDAEAIEQFLRHLGTVAARPTDTPAALCHPTPLAGSEALIADRPGLVCYRRALGETIRAGEAVAEIIDPATGATHPVTATTSGVFYARADSRVAETGKRLGKIAGATPFRSGLLLSP